MDISFAAVFSPSLKRLWNCPAIKASAGSEFLHEAIFQEHFAEVRLWRK